MSFVRLLLVVLAISAASLLVACGGGDEPDAKTPEGNSTTPESGNVVQTPDTEEASVDQDLIFIDAMIVHHQSAIDMAEVAGESAERQEVRDLAGEIIHDQRREIDQMMEWRAMWYPGAADSDLSDMMHMAGMHMSEHDMDSMRHADDVDMEFMDQMIPHHESAVEMARSILETTERKELRELAEEVIDAQTREIEQMREWMREWSHE
jgi:uncharacterized protein (DUF305 family)